MTVPDSQPNSPDPISVVVCTRDRPESLARCLAALARLDPPAAEVIVVDSASSGAETARVAAAAGFRCVREEQTGLDRARNRGWREARCAIVAYTDDDTEAEPGWLAGAAAALRDPKVAVVTGRVLAASVETAAERLFESYGGMDKGPLPITFSPRQMCPRAMIAAHRCGVGASMALRRDALARLGGFDPALDVGTPARGGGDLDLFHRALAAGLTVRYEPSMVVHHHHRRTVAELERQLEDNGRSFGVYLIKILATRSVPRVQLLRFAAGWVGVWLVCRMLLALAGRLGFPAPLVWAELRGALQAPGAYRAAYRDARRREAELEAADAAT